MNPERALKLLDKLNKREETQGLIRVIFPEYIKLCVLKDTVDKIPDGAKVES